MSLPNDNLEYNQRDPDYVGVPVSPRGARNFLKYIGKPLKAHTAEEIAKLSDKLDRLALKDLPEHLKEGRAP